MQFSGSKKGRQAKLPAVPEQIRKDWPAKWPGSGRNAAGFVQKLSACRPEGCFRAAAAAEKQLFRQQNWLSGVLWNADWERVPQKNSQAKAPVELLPFPRCGTVVPQKIPGTAADGRLVLWIDANFAEIAEFAKSVHTGTLQLEKKAVYYG